MLSSAFFNIWTILAMVLVVVAYILMILTLKFDWPEKYWKWVVISLVVIALVCGVIGGIYFWNFLDKHVMFI